MRVGVIGAAGRMGTAVCEAVQGAEGHELVAAVDTAPAGDAGRSVGGVRIAGGLSALADAGAEVAVDFTVAGAATANGVWCAEHGVHCVIGTSGVDDDSLAALRRAFPVGGPLGCVVAPNFAIGAVLMMRFAALAAPWFDSAEIIELHHDGKIDAPSGTALMTARRMAEASDRWGEDPTRVEAIPGARGALGPAGIRIHSVRLRGLVAHQEVLLGGPGQSITIRHDSYDRRSFMPGVLLAVGAVASRPGVTVGLEVLLGL